MEDKQMGVIRQEIVDCMNIMEKVDRPTARGVALGLMLARDIIDKYMGGIKGDEE